MPAQSDENGVGRSEEPFVSRLDKGRERFLSHVIVNALELGRRTPTDFIRHFPPAEIMKGLELRPHLRAKILEPSTGVRHKIALKKSAMSAGDDLQIAMDEGEATAEQVVSFFHPDDRVRHLDHKKLWAFVMEGEFWKAPQNSTFEFECAKAHIAFMIDRALEDKLVSHENLVEGVSIDELAESLPRERLAAIIKAAINLGRDKKPFTDSDLLDTAASTILVQEISLAHIWETTIVPKIALPHGFVDSPAEPNFPHEEVTEVKDPLQVTEVKGAPQAKKVETTAAERTDKPAPKAVVAATQKNKGQAPENAAPAPAASATKSKSTAKRSRPEKKTDPNIRQADKKPNGRSGTDSEWASGVVGVVSADSAEEIEEIELVDFEDEFGEEQHTQLRKR